MQDTLPLSPDMSPPKSKRPTGLIMATTSLAVMLVGALIFGVIQVTSLASTKDDLSAVQTNLRHTKADLTSTQDELSTTQDDLSNAQAQAASCVKAADLLAKGANGYVDLWNELDDAADRWNIVFAFYLRGIMRDTNVTNTTLSAGWDALDKCEAGSASVSLA